jgi:hypothetical protein
VSRVVIEDVQVNMPGVTVATNLVIDAGQSVQIDLQFIPEKIKVKLYHGRDYVFHEWLDYPSCHDLYLEFIK